MIDSLQAFSDRLNEALDLRNYPPFRKGRINYVQEVFCISRSAANKWLHGKVLPHPKARKALANKLGVSLTWLETGVGSLTDVNQEDHSASNQVLEIPLLDLEEVYNYKEMLKKNESFEINSEKIIISNTHSKSCFAVTIVGKAMLPKFNAGDLLIVDPTQRVEDGDFVIASSPLLPEAIFRQFIVGSGGSFLISINPKFEPIKLTKDCCLFGKVVETRVKL